MVLKGRGTVAGALFAKLNHQDSLIVKQTELSFPSQSWALRFLNPGLGSLRASDVLKLCTDQGKSVQGQSWCSYPSGSFQLRVGLLSTIFIRETLELVEGQSCLDPAQVIGEKNSKVTLLQKKERLHLPDYHERKGPTFV